MIFCIYCAALWPPLPTPTTSTLCKTQKNKKLESQGVKLIQEEPAKGITNTGTVSDTTKGQINTLYCSIQGGQAGERATTGTG